VQDLERCALGKFGEEGLADKRAKRDKRVANKRKREEDAKQVSLLSAALQNEGVVGQVFCRPGLETWPNNPELLTLSPASVTYIRLSLYPPMRACWAPENSLGNPSISHQMSSVAGLTTKNSFSHNPRHPRGGNNRYPLHAKKTIPAPYKVPR
jgi:hypothetical protein